MKVGDDSQAEPFWTEFLRSLTCRAQRGVKPVTGDNHEGIKAGIAKVLKVIWQRCGAKCTRQRCQVAFRTLATAALMPSWLSLMTSLTPRSPRRMRLRRNSVQNGSASLGPTFMPST